MKLGILLLFLLVNYVPYSATLEVISAGVEVQRVNTSQWLALPAGSVAPVGAGDRIRTNEEGRAWLHLSNAADTLLLPETTFTFVQFDVTDEGQGQVIEFVANTQGVSVHQIQPGAVFTTYQLTLTDLTITQPALLFAVWSYEDDEDAVAAFRGTLEAEDVTLDAREGLWLSHPDQVVRLNNPLNAARIEAAIDGCEATVRTEDGRDLLIRRGPGQGYERLGLLPDGAAVSLLGVTESGNWSRILFLSSFGWVQTLALQSTCTDLISYPDDIPQEKLTSVINVTEAELAVLQPFFGMLVDNPYFYRSEVEG